MNIRVSGLFGRQHSWSYTSRSIAAEFLSMGNNITVSSTDGKEFVKGPLLECFDKDIGNIDLDLTYTLPKNFKHRFLQDSKIKASIFNYESSILPDVWKRDDRYLDYIFPSSNYCKNIFIDAGWDEKKIRVVPLGVDYEAISSAERIEDFDDGKFNFLTVSIPHYRKHLDVLVESYYKAFKGRDDVRLILKTSLDKPKNRFECFIPKIIHDIQVKLRYPSYPCLTLVNENYKNLGSLYKAADCLVSTSGSEGFGLTMLEAMCAKTLVVSTSVTGHKDFINNKNSIIIPSKPMKATEKHQYWRVSKGAQIFKPDGDSLVDIFIDTFNNKDSMLLDRIGNMTETAKKYSWHNTARLILKECS